jgi:hypothetical protein
MDFKLLNEALSRFDQELGNTKTIMARSVYMGNDAVQRILDTYAEKRFDLIQNVLRDRVRKELELPLNDKMD